MMFFIALAALVALGAAYLKPAAEALPSGEQTSPDDEEPPFDPSRKTVVTLDAAEHAELVVEAPLLWSALSGSDTRAQRTGTKTYQRKAKIEVDGVYGPITAGALLYGLEDTFGEDAKAVGEWFYANVIRPVFGDGPTMFADMKKVLNAYAELAEGIAGFLGFFTAISQGLIGAAYAADKSQLETDRVGKDWIWQRARWQALYRACDEGERLPYYDRFFHYRGVTFTGSNPDTDDMNQKVRYFGASAFRHKDARRGLFACVPEHTRKLVEAVASRLGWSGIEDPSVSYVEEIYDLPIVELRRWYCDPPYHQRTYVRGNNGLPVIDPETGKALRRIPFTIDPLTGRRLPHANEIYPTSAIPCELVGLIPEVYIVFWLAPAAAIESEAGPARLLRVFEEERAKSPYHFSRGGQPKPPIGAPFIHGDRAWGALERMYSDTHWFDRDSVLRLLPKPPPASSFWRDLGVSLSSIVLGDVATASMEERPALLPETYEAILEQYRAWIDLENDTPHGGLSRQRLIEVAKRPDVQEAIAFAKAIRAGSQRAQDEARALIGRVSVPTPDAVDVRRLGLLMKALEHDRAPRRKGTFPRTEAA